MKVEVKRQKRAKRKRKIRGSISGTSEMPRLSVFRSNKHIYGQIIDDEAQSTLTSISDAKFKGTKIEKATEVGKEIAKLAKAKKITKIVFDRSGYRYHGRIQAFANGAREGGLQF